MLAYGNLKIRSLVIIITDNYYSFASFGIVICERISNNYFYYIFYDFCSCTFFEICEFGKSK
jgi:hypothetical protein